MHERRTKWVLNTSSFRTWRVLEDNLSWLLHTYLVPLLLEGHFFISSVSQQFASFSRAALPQATLRPQSLQSSGSEESPESMLWKCSPVWRNQPDPACCTIQIRASQEFCELCSSRSFHCKEKVFCCALCLSCIRITRWVPQGTWLHAVGTSLLNGNGYAPSLKRALKCHKRHLERCRSDDLIWCRLVVLY